MKVSVLLIVVAVMVCAMVQESEQVFWGGVASESLKSSEENSKSLSNSKEHLKENSKEHLEDHSKEKSKENSKGKSHSIFGGISERIEEIKERMKGIGKILGGGKKKSNKGQGTTEGIPNLKPTEDTTGADTKADGGSQQQNTGAGRDRAPNSSSSENSKENRSS